MNDSEKALRKKKITHAILMVVMIFVLILFIFPFFMVIVNVFKVKADIIRNPLSLIGEKKGFTLANFPNAMAKMDFWRVFFNSLIITITSTILTILFSSMTAFVIVRNDWKACKILFAAMIASMVVPFQVLMVPLVSLYGGVLSVLNHRITLILMHTGFSLSMAVFMPTIATVTVIDAMAFWNDYLLPSLVLTKSSLYTIPIATQKFYGTYTSDLGLIMASLLLAMLPILILYLFLQKFIVEGVTSGAVKG